MRQYYPIFLRVEGRLCLVIGGGAVAERKVLTLLGAGAQVMVVSPTLTAALAAKAVADEIVHRARGYQPEDLEGVWIAFAATNDPVVHHAVARDAAAMGVPLNVVDEPQLCSFIAPAVMARGDLTIAISTGGASPALAKRVRQELEQQFGPEYGHALAILAAVRRRLQSEALAQPERQAILTALVQSELVEYLRAGQRAEVDRILSTTVGDGTSVASLGVRLV